ncbi:hypothetical protein VV40_004905 [Salmonella enterica subsp. enterica serovar Pomona]|nr:hypothetical protein [Salmonella enterica subsp. enterica serovar Pomona]
MNISGNDRNPVVSASVSLPLSAFSLGISPKSMVCVIWLPGTVHVPVVTAALKVCVPVVAAPAISGMTRTVMHNGINTARHAARVKRVNTDNLILFL